MKFNRTNSRHHRWGAILAGGDGKRLLPLTRRITGDDRPKQFCPIMGNETLLQQTQRRISRLIPQSRTLLMLTRTHETCFADQVAGMASSRTIIQPCNQGTAPAILYSIMRLREMDSKGIVAFFPSAIETMQLGGLAGLTALTMGIGQERANKERESRLVTSNGSKPVPVGESLQIPLIPEAA